MALSGPGKLAFRQSFKVGNGSKPNFNKWFPRHMFVGLKKMQAKLRNVDCVIEVHDSRIPLTGRNLNFQHELYSIKPHILVMNKMDLIGQKNMELEYVLKDKLGAKHVLWADLKHKRRGTLRELYQILLEEVANFPRFHRTFKTEYQVMVIGIPNVGKSTLINGLRGEFLNKSAAAKVGPTPGVTRHVMEKIRINDNPRIYVFDTPGVLEPKVNDIETGLKMIICQTVMAHVQVEIQADYLLYFLNKRGNFSYVDHMKLEDATDNVFDLLTQIAQNFNLTRQANIQGEGRVVTMDLDGAAHFFLTKFRNGEFGHQFMDGDILDRFKIDGQLIQSTNSVEKPLNFVSKFNPD